MSLDIISHYSQFDYLPGNRFAYDARLDIINYVADELKNNAGRLALLHETSHALLGHFHFSTDIELFFMEVAAWHKTAELAPKFKVALNKRYIKNCLNSYDQWLTERATCPYCQNFCLPQSAHHYRCFGCETEWDVTTDRDEVVSQTITKAPIAQRLGA